MRNHSLLPFALSLLLSGCVVAPASRNEIKSCQESTGTLILRLSGFSTQALCGVETLDIEVKVDSNAPIPRRINAANLKYTNDVTFSIPVGSGEATVKAFDAQGTLLSSGSASFFVKPGIPTIAKLELLIGGSGALDTGIHVEEPYLASIATIGEYDPAFSMFDGTQNYRWEYRFIKDGVTSKVVYTYKNWPLTETWNDGATQSINTTSDSFFLRVPQHAQLIDSAPIMSFSKVRHIRFANLFSVENQDKLLTIDRYYTPQIGLIKETVSEGSTLISTMELATASSIPW